MKSIFDLCRELPASEPELRGRAGEFNRAVWVAVSKNMYSAIQGTPDYLNSIADAKAATDRMIETAGTTLNIHFDHVNRLYFVEIRRSRKTGGNEWTSDYVRDQVQALASTEELARSAAALLAAEAMKGQITAPPG